jgi:2-aminoadipate transaminase
MVTFARRAQKQNDELTTILAGSPEGVLSLAGGFPNPATFPAELLDELMARVLRDEPGVALQYAPCEGIPSVREYLIERQEQLHGRRPELEEFIVTSGGMECIALACQSLIDPGDTVAVEAPTYLGALMAFERYEARVEGVPIDDDGLLVDALADRLEGGLAPKLLYVIPDYQNPSGRTLPVARREALVDLCRRHGVLILEDVAYREISFDGAAPPSLWSLGPDVVVQAGTFSKIFCPGVRMGWAAGPREVIAQLAAAKQTTDQCSGGLGQKLVEAYGRAGHFERQIPASRELYASHWRALERGLRAHMPEGVTWSRPLGGFFSWITLPEGIDTIALRPLAVEAGVAYVPGAPFGGAPNELRVAFSYLGEPELESAASRLSSVVSSAV